jgi:hypothetical protein
MHRGRCGGVEIDEVDMVPTPQRDAEELEIAIRLHGQVYVEPFTEHLVPCGRYAVSNAFGARTAKRLHITIHVFSMPDVYDSHRVRGVIDLIYHSIITYPHPPCRTTHQLP